MTVRPTRILYVEDEALVREVVALELEDAGFEVHQVEDGPTAVALIDEDAQFDALLTDIRLPGGIDGLRIAELARAAAQPSGCLRERLQPRSVEARARRAAVRQADARRRGDRGARRSGCDRALSAAGANAA